MMKERADVKEQIWVTKKFSESLRVLEEQRKQEVHAAKQEIAKQRVLLLQEREEQRRLLDRERWDIKHQRDEFKAEKKRLEQEFRSKAKKLRKQKSSIAALHP